MTTHSIELDTVTATEAGDQTAEETIAQMEKEWPGVTGRLVKRHGPGGGWPIIEWSGDEASMRPMLTKAYEFSEDEIKEWLVAPEGL